MKRKMVRIGPIEGAVGRVIRGKGNVWEVQQNSGHWTPKDGGYGAYKYKNGKCALIIWRGRGEKIKVLQQVYREDTF